jgi:DNA-directed RNA polymerase subunit RPC12/RpoP
MRFIVFKCRKCEHHLYVENTEEVVEKIKKVSNLDCPNCGEDPDGNWVLVGLRKNFPNSEKETVKCKDCEYLELELPYGVCSKAYKGMVRPDDTCPNGKRREK